MDIENDQKYYSFCLRILNAFHLDSFIFFKNLAQENEYETLIFYWIDELYKRNIPVDESISFIHKARRQKIFYGKTIELPKKKSSYNSNKAFPCSPEIFTNSLIIINKAS